MRSYTDNLVVFAELVATDANPAAPIPPAASRG